MRPRNTLLWLQLLVFVLAFSVENASAQSSQYSRGKKSSSKSSKTGKKHLKGDKVDISELEEKYWASKDTEFKVVQNRLYSKEKRIGLHLGSGPIVNDGFSIGNLYGLGVSYYFNERMGVELEYNQYDLRDSKMTSNFINQYGGVRPNFNRYTSYVGAKFNWVPIYAKLSLLDKHILYFDFIVSAGFGMLSYDHLVIQDPSTPSNATTVGKANSAPVFSLDIAQQVYIHRNWAIRIDVLNRFIIGEKILDWRDHSEVRDESNLSTAIMFGATYFFGKGEKK